MSHPSWVCGLKLACFTTLIKKCLSHPSWVCGLKHAVTSYTGVCAGHTLRGCVDWNTDNVSELAHKIVTPFVGVWIETPSAPTTTKQRLSHTLRGCVDWNMPLSNIVRSQQSHPSWVCGLKQRWTKPLEVWQTGHTLRGCVDWNFHLMAQSLSRYCHTLRGCVDWNNADTGYLGTDMGHTLRGCVDWNRKQILFSEPTWKSHFYENVPLIVNKLQRQKIWFGTFLSGLSLVLYSKL